MKTFTVLTLQHEGQTFKDGDVRPTRILHVADDHAEHVASELDKFQGMRDDPDCNVQNVALEYEDPSRKHHRVQFKPSLIESYTIDEGE